MSTALAIAYILHWLTLVLEFAVLVLKLERTADRVGALVPLYDELKLILLLALIILRQPVSTSRLARDPDVLPWPRSGDR